MKKYKITHRGTKETKTVQANSFQEACQKLEWFVSNCWYVIVSEEVA